MDRAEEIFTMQLARAAGKTANKFLRARGLQKSDRDDVISAALLWCWENRANYSLVTTLETWFMNAVRNSYQDLKRRELPTSDESLDNIGGTDTTYDAVAAESSAEAFLSTLSPVDREIASLMTQGYTYREIWKKGYPKQTVDKTRQRLKRVLHSKLVDAKLAASSTSPAASSDDAGGGQVPQIDIELERLEFAPPAGKDCPPCWRCMWFEGFMPAGHRSTRMDIEDLEVRAAVQDTEARKVEVAQQVRDGDIQFIGIGRC